MSESKQTSPAPTPTHHDAISHRVFIGLMLMLPILLALKTCSPGVIWKKKPGIKFHSRNHLAFDYDLHGIDVSHHNGYIKWPVVAKQKVFNQPISFAFIKASEGKEHRDRRFKQNWKGSKQAGIPRGAYHFYLPWVNSTVQARNFIAAVGSKHGELPPIMDFEKTYMPHGRKNAMAGALNWLRLVEKAYGVKPIIYTSNSIYHSYFERDKRFQNYHFWIARYNHRRTPTTDWTIWQHSKKGRVKGISGKVDLSVARVHPRQLASLVKGR